MGRTRLHFKLVKPGKLLQDLVYSFSSLHIPPDLEDGVIIPNGRIDLICSRTNDQQFRISLIGLETKPKILPDQNISDLFVISFNPLAVEYILREPIAGIVDRGKYLPPGFWDFNIEDLNDFEAFCRKASRKITSLLPKEIDERKRELFDLIFTHHGELSIRELAEKVRWSERQINRYFNKQFGVSAKAYCKIIRFQSSLPHIKDGILSPQLNFSDQSHFIKEIRQFSGVSPRELARNPNDRFLQFLATGTE